MVPARVNTSGSSLARWSWKPRMRILAAGVCFLQLASTPSAAEPELVKLAVSEGTDIRFAHLTSNDGLSAGQVRGIVQDDQGFLWINTTGVLNRYDGYQFKSYSRDPAHPNYPAGGFIHTIFKDLSGFLWVSSNESLDRFDPTTETTTRFPIDRNGPHSVLGPVTHVSQDRAGIVWLSTRTGLHRLDPASGAFRHYAHDSADPDSLSSSLVKSTYEDREGTLWVCTVAGLDAFDRRTEKVTERIRLHVAESRTVKALEDHAGVLWIMYAFGNGLASWDRHTRRLTLYSFEEREPQGIHEDADGNLWLATRLSGLVRIDRNRRSAVQYRSISEDFTKTVFEDREGSIWVGMGTTGLNRFERNPLPFKRYRHEPDNPRSLLETYVMAVYADRQENIWVGSPLGLTRIDGKTGGYSFFRKPGPDPENLSSTTSIAEDRSGHLWFGTYGDGLKRYDPKTGKFAVFRHDPADPHSLSNDVVYSLMVDRQGLLWAGTDDGLNRCEDPVTGRFRSWKGDPVDPSPTDVRAMVEDSNGVLWLVSSTLQRFDPATGHFTAYTFDPFGTGTAGRKDSPFLVKVGRRIAEDSFLAIDRSGVLWMATANGLLRFDREREQFIVYDQRDGLPASAVNGMLEDRNGNLWVSTASGLSRLNPRTKTLSNYYEADGLAGSAFEGFPAAHRSQRGQMFFGSKSGLTSFWPEQIVEKPFTPPVVLTGFSLRNQPVAPGPGSLLAKSIAFTPSLTLSHDQNHIFSFEFAALSYVDPQRNQYRYMLEPLDHSWNRVDPNHRMAVFTTLPAGKYTLRVQGSNNRGVWNEQGVTLRLEILPPWWGTWWFRITCAGLFLALLSAAYRVRVRSVERHSAEISAFNEQLMKAQEQERTRIAGELHDSVMQQISALSLVLGTAKRKMPADTEARDMVVDVQRKLIDVGTEVRQLSHDLYPPMLKQAGLAEVLRGYCDTFSHSRGIPASCDVDESVADLSPGTALALYRIAQEALGNAAKHASPTRLDVRLLRIGADVVLTVADDGQGYPPGGVADGGLGLVNMRERARQLGGTFELDSWPGRGTTVRVAVPFRMREANPPDQTEAQK